MITGRRFECIEIPATHILKLNVITNQIKLYSWDGLVEYQECKVDDWVESVKLVQGLPDEEFSIDASISWNAGEDVSDF